MQVNSVPHVGAFIGVCVLCAASCVGCTKQGGMGAVHAPLTWVERGKAREVRIRLIVHSTTTRASDYFDKVTLHFCCGDGEWRSRDMVVVEESEDSVVYIMDVVCEKECSSSSGEYYFSGQCSRGPFRRPEVGRYRFGIRSGDVDEFN